MKTINGFDVIVTQEEINKAVEALGYDFTKDELDLFLVELREKTRSEQIKSEIEQAIQKMLDDKAKELRYDNMMSARSYAGFENPFQAEAQKLAVWCAECWKKVGELEATGNVYTVEEVLAQMPVYGA